MNRLEVAPVATILVVLYALVGAVIVVLSASGSVDKTFALTFHGYLEQMAIAVAGLAVGRGLAARKPR